MLAKAGWKVIFLGIKTPETERLEFPSHKNIKLKQLSYRPPGWRQKLHYLWFVTCAIALAIFFRPNLVYSSDPLSATAGWLLTFLPSARAIYHEHDSPSDNDGSLFMWLIYAARALLARRAAVCILPNRERALAFLRENPSANTHCVWNCPSLEEIGLSPERADNALWLMYHGSIVPARLPISILLALRELPANVKLRIVGFETLGHQGYARELLATARRLGLAGRVEIVGAVATRKELFELCRQSHVGLALMPAVSPDVNLTHMVGASNKAFDYLACGMALLVSDLPDWRALFVDEGYGLACEPSDPHSIAKSVNWFLQHRDEMRLMGERGRQKIATEWNYETQFAPVLDVLEPPQSKGAGAVTTNQIAVTSLNK